MTIHVRPARNDDVQKYYPDNRASFRAWVAELDGDVAGIIGLIMSRPIACAVSTFSEELRPYLRSMPVLRAIKKLHLACREYNGVIVAVAEPTEQAAEDSLARFGFIECGESHGQTIYRFEA